MKIGTNPKANWDKSAAATAYFLSKVLFRVSWDIKLETTYEDE
jgi:hypothetical protein